MEYNINKQASITELCTLYDSVGWGAYTQNPERLKAACDHSLLLVAARAAGQLVGLIRVVGDGETIIYIQDLLVQPSYQGRGIGSHLIELVLKKYPAVRQKVLLTEEAPDTRAFYEKNGFASCDHGSLVAFYREF